MESPRCHHETAPTKNVCGTCGTPLTVDPSGAPASSYSEVTSAERGAGAAGCDPRDPHRHRPLAHRSPTGSRSGRAKRGAAVPGADVSLYRIEGDLMRKAAGQGAPLRALRVGDTRPITGTTVSGRAILDRTTIHLPDHQSAEAVRQYPDARRDTGMRRTIGIPRLREGVAIGAFTACRTRSWRATRAISTKATG
jgi:hypothetical protein